MSLELNESEVHLITVMRENQELKNSQVIGSDTSSRLKCLQAANDVTSQDIKALVEDPAFLDALLNDEYVIRLLQAQGFYEAPPVWVKASKYRRMSDFTEDSLNSHRKSHWQRGKHWTIAADGKVYYNWREIDNWVDSSSPKPR